MRPQVFVEAVIVKDIQVIRGKRVLLDFQLAAIYQIEAKRLNEQVKRNSERFPEDFMFQLMEDEMKNLMSQNVTYSGKHLIPIFLPIRDIYPFILFIFAKGEIQNRMEKKSNHVIPSHGGWAVKKTGSARASRIFDTRDKAIEYGRILSQSEKTELFIHQRNGMIQERNSYALEPKTSKG